MKLRVACLVVCGLLIGYSASSLLAQPEALFACCDGGGQCGTGKCCDPDSVGRLPCTPEAPGYCMTACIPNSH